jgi:hypothetical protein
VRPFFGEKEWHYLDSITRSDCLGSSHGTFHSHVTLSHHHVALSHHVTLSWELWKLWDLHPGVLLLLLFLSSLLLELLIGFEGVGVGSSHADEVSVEERDDGGKEKTPNDVGLLGLSVVTLVWGSGEDISLLVHPENVAHVPDGQKAGGDDNKLASNEKSGSRVVGVIREECNEESDSNEEWHKENNSNKDVPPVVGLVKEAVENFAEDGQEQDVGEHTDCDNTALHWEATEALEVDGLLGGAVADAAAAQASLLLLGKFLEGLSFFWFFLGVTHKWGFIHGSAFFHHHHGFVFH